MEEKVSRLPYSLNCTLPLLPLCRTSGSEHTDCVTTTKKNSADELFLALKVIGNTASNTSLYYACTGGYCTEAVLLCGNYLSLSLTVSQNLKIRTVKVTKWTNIRKVCVKNQSAVVQSRQRWWEKHYVYQNSGKSALTFAKSIFELFILGLGGQNNQCCSSNDLFPSLIPLVDPKRPQSS